MIVPVPDADPVTAPWWEATRERRLLVQRCAGCGRRQHPPRAVCTACGSMDHLTFAAASGRGVIDSGTVVHRAPRPGLVTPYTIVRVRLDEGPLLLSRLVDASGAGAPEPAIGAPVALTWHELDDGRALPIFQNAPIREA